MTTEPLEFTSAVRRDEPMTFTLDGKDYTIRPAKEAIRILQNKFFWLDASLDAYDWSVLDDAGRRAAYGLEPLDAEGNGQPTPANYPDGWSGAQSTELGQRLRDPNDRFDVDTLEKVVDAIIERVAGRPTM
jgi:hypothetical protein